jgi:hypothetical protein
MIGIDQMEAMGIFFVEGEITLTVLDMEAASPTAPTATRVPTATIGPAAKAAHAPAARVTTPNFVLKSVTTVLATLNQV